MTSAKHLLLAGLSTASLSLAVAAPTFAASQTFTSQGCGPSNDFVVPAGITSVGFDVHGGPGASALGAVGGLGVRLQGDLSVAPGETLHLCVGEGGGAAGPLSAAGGGYSSISRNADDSNPELVAGGGGGAAGSLGGYTAGGGDAGRLSVNGNSGSDGPTPAYLTAAHGATLLGTGYRGWTFSGMAYDGGDGVDRDGGHGGTPALGGTGGGGGGGGFFGGGGGGGSPTAGYSGGGGGGGSTYCPMQCSDELSNLSAAEITFSWAHALAPVFRVEPATAFAPTAVGAVTTGTFTLTNAGTDPVGVRTLSLEGPDNGDFKLDPGSCVATLAAGEHCDIAVKFIPTAEGTRTATLRVEVFGAAEDLLVPLSASTPAAEAPGGGDTPPVTVTPPPAAPTPGPQTTGCGSHRTVEIKVRGTYRRSLLQASATVAGKRVATFRDGKAQLDFTGRPAGKVRVKIVMKLRGGRTRTEVRTYQLCAPRKQH